MKIKRLISAVIIAVLLTGCSGLRKVQDISLTSWGVKYLVPTSARSVDAVLLLGIDNPTFAFTVSDVDGTLKRNGIPVVYFKAGEVEVKARTSTVYELPGSAMLADKTSILDLLSIAARSNYDGLTVDVALKVKLKSGLGTTLNYKDIDVTRFTQ